MTEKNIAPRDADRAAEIAGYGELLENLKLRIRKAQVRAALAVNRELVLLYWQLGREILARQREEGWGARVIDRHSHDLRRAFPDMAGFSARNLKYMRAFAEAYPDEPFVQQPVAQIPWGHNTVLLDRLKGTRERRRAPVPLPINVEEVLGIGGEGVVVRIARARMRA